MATDTREWRPGSFTKNYTWGKPERGLAELHTAINLGFDGELKDTPRSLFRERIAAHERPDFIPINFFLFNRNIGGVDHIVVDELVFQALKVPHSASFDKLALFAFGLSMVGKWHGAAPYQRWPALWAKHYIVERVARAFDWNTSRVSANDIERYVESDSRYTGRTARKLATNLNYLYQVGRLNEFASDRVERWWVDCLFLALDRMIEDRKIDSDESAPGLNRLLVDSRFSELSGKQSLAKELAMRHLTTLYEACGSRDRFLDETVREITALRLPDVQWLVANDDRPQGAVHPTNPNILKSIPRACALLAKYYAGFDVIDAEELAIFDPAEFVRRRTKSALQNLRDRGVRPTMTSDELMKLTRMTQITRGALKRSSSIKPWVRR